MDDEAESRASASDVEDWGALLLPLARAQDALARLEAAAALASQAVREGLVARLALHEAAGWLTHNGVSVSATDLALRDAGLVGAWGIAAPPTGEGGAVLDDRLTGQALRLARAWRELADGGDGDSERAALRQAFAALNCRGSVDDDAWPGRLTWIGEGQADLPVLIQAAQVAGRWQRERAAAEGRGDLLSAPALFLAASLWRGRRHDALESMQSYGVPTRSG